MPVTASHHHLPCLRALALNPALRACFEALRDAPTTRHSHYFGGRYENTYIDPAACPAFAELLQIAREHAAKILEKSESDLKVGGWFNAMRPGASTTLHSHDDDQELLSCVYYIEVAPGCGDLLLHYPDNSVTITPEAGMFVFFPPDLPHEVSPNHSRIERLSVGINVGY